MRLDSRALSFICVVLCVISCTLPNRLSVNTIESEKVVFSSLELVPFKTEHPHFLWWMSFAGQLEALEDTTTFERLVKNGFFEKQLKKYPPRFFKQAPIPVLFFAQSVKSSPLLGGGNIQGFSVNALNRRVSFLSLDPAVYKVQGLDVALHHEIFHLIDDSSQDALWRNCASSVNSTSHEISEDKRVANQLYPQAGFVSEYAMADIKEDRAEMFAWLMASPELAQALQQYILTDPILNCKYQLLLKYLASRFPNFNTVHISHVASGLQEGELNQPRVTELHIFKTEPAFAPSNPAFLPITTLPVPSALAQYDRLVTFESNLPYTSVSPSLEAWEGLQNFRLTDHRLSDFPEITRAWYSLRHLVLKGKPFKRLPDSVGELGRLRRLEVDLEGPLNEKVTEMGRLELLDLNLTEQSVLPDTLSKLGFLPELLLSGVYLENIQGLKGMNNLETLTLRYLPAWKTPVQDLKTLLPLLHKLKTLTLSHEQLSATQKEQLEAILPPTVQFDQSGL